MLDLSYLVDSTPLLAGGVSGKRDFFHIFLVKIDYTTNISYNIIKFILTFVKKTDIIFSA